MTHTWSYGDYVYESQDKYKFTHKLVQETGLFYLLFHKTLNIVKDPLIYSEGEKWPFCHFPQFLLGKKQPLPVVSAVLCHNFSRK